MATGGAPLPEHNALAFLGAPGPANTDTNTSDTLPPPPSLGLRDDVNMGRTHAPLPGREQGRHDVRAGRRVAGTESDRAERQRWHRTELSGLSAWDKHVRYINNYVLWYGDGSKHLAEAAAAVPPPRNDYDVLAEQHRFVWTDEDMETMDWEKAQAFKYYQKLFKEYALVDLSLYKSNRIALRWCTQSEVLEGKGQFICGAIGCTSRHGLVSYEVNFGYMEHGTKRNALVKLRLCPTCADKLNYRHRRKAVTDPPLAGAGGHVHGAVDDRQRSQPRDCVDPYLDPHTKTKPTSESSSRESESKRRKMSHKKSKKDKKKRRSKDKK